MKTVIKIAWRNCWRNRLRSSIVILTIILGIWSSIFLMGFTEGLIVQRTEKMVNLQIGDIQIHSKSFDYNSEISNVVENYEEIEMTLESDDNVAVFSPRFRIEAYAASAHGQAGIKLIGVDVEKEIQTLDLSSKLVEGTFLESDLAYPILVGQKISEDLHLKLGSKIQVSFTNIDSTQISKTFKVCGIFKSGDDIFDGYNVFVPKDKIEKLTGTQLIHEVVVKCKDPKKSPIVANTLSSNLPNNLVQNWEVRYPEIFYMIEMMDIVNYVLMTIIVAALLFGIINTLVMSILERKREIGVLLAVGMNKRKIRLMIIVESVIYGLIGGPLGLLIGYLTILYYGNYGFDLSAFGEGMEAFGYDSVIYLKVGAKYYFIYTAFILVATIIGGIYPSRIATRLNPTSAIRSV